jgi:exopolyphosphatase/guanosine-5'-triphosphate,3'-diphosphate pyrophosphatase
MEKLPLSDPPTAEEEAACRKLLREFLRTEVAPKLLPAINHELELSFTEKRICLVGTGGTATILARVQASLETFDRARIEGTVLSNDAVHEQMARLWSLPISRRKEVTGLPKDRADVILTGVAIYSSVMEEFGFKELRVSTRGLRFAALIQG